MRYKPPTPDPSPQEIRKACWKIQATWTPAERQRRAAYFSECEIIRIPMAIDLGGSWHFEDSTPAISAK